MPRIAIIQHAPHILDKQQTVQQAAGLIRQAAAEGAQLVVFPEAFIPGYPAWIWRLRPGGDWNLYEELHTRLLHNAIDLASDDMVPICEAARDNRVTVVCGLNEKDNRNSRATLYNSVVTIDDDGTIINHHRKLMPTNPERMVWGFGDGQGLNVVDTPIGRIGALVCWENYLPQARLALYAQGVQIHIAPTYDSGDGWLGTLQHIAREGRCWVLGCGVALQRSDLPADFPDLDRLYPADEDWINPGDSVVIAPGGQVVAGPLSREKGCLYADIDADRSDLAKRALDVAGHYARPDVFNLHVNRERQSPVTFQDAPNSPTPDQPTTR